jgi:murein DD-endopeptidase MepM/ murein hydrolase activator NlpD
MPSEAPGRRRGTRHRRSVALCLVALTLVAVHPVAADQISDKQAQRGQVGGFISNLQGQIATTQDKEAKVKSVIAAIDAQIARTQASAAAAQNELERIAQHLAAEQQHLEQTKVKLAADKVALANDMRLVFMAANDSTTMNNLLTSGDFNEFWRRLFDLRRISAGEHDVTEAVRRETDDIQSTVDRIGQQEKQQQATVAQLNDTLQQLSNQQADRLAAQQALATVEADDQKRLADNVQAAHQLDSEIASLQEAQRQAEEAARRRAAALAAGAAAAQRSGQGGLVGGLVGGGGTGQFQWPERGPITQGFGCSPYSFEQYDPSCPSRHFHSGIDIGAPGGTPIGASDAGIAYVYPGNTGYGNHVIIIHGGGFATVYGHLARFNVGNGEQVAVNRVIGYEGSTGNSTGPHLHFEIRLNDSPVNPFKYLP